MELRDKTRFFYHRLLGIAIPWVSNSNEILITEGMSHITEGESIIEAITNEVSALRMGETLLE